MSEAKHGPELRITVDQSAKAEAALDACFLVSDVAGLHPARVVVTGRLSVAPVNETVFSVLSPANTNADICCV